MQYGTVIPARFLERPNRFIARVDSADGELICHVKNTGRCRELLTPGAVVYLERAKNPNRRTGYDLIAVEKGGLLVNMDAQAPNCVFGEWAEAGGFLPDIRAVRPEYSYGASRIDFCLETERGVHLVEVKGVTLEENGHARFPDAPTERGVRHLHELRRAVEQGLSASLVFIVQMEGMRDVSPNDGMHPAFGAALREAAAAGVGVRAFTCAVEPDSIAVSGEIPVIL